MASAKRHVLLVRAAKGNSVDDPYIAPLNDAGYTCTHCINALSFHYINTTQLHSALHDVHSYSGVVLSSARAVTAISTALATDTTIIKQWSSLPAYVVGKATCTAAQELGLTPTGEHAGNSEVLAQYIIQDDKLDRSKPLLYPCANLAKDTLPKVLTQHGIQLHTITAYETCAHPHLLDALRDHVTQHGTPDALVLFSPSGLAAMLPVLKELHIDITHIKCIAIGNTTRSAMLDAGVDVSATATTPDPTGVLHALKTSS